MACLVVCLTFAMCRSVQRLSDKEVKKEYAVACSYMENRQYVEARELLEKILPFAEEETHRQILSQLSDLWMIEGARFIGVFKFGQGVDCLEKACKGYHETGNSKDELKVLCNIGDFKVHLNDIQGAMEAYRQAWALADSMKIGNTCMYILKKQCKLAEQFGNSGQKQELRAKMDSLIISFAGDDKLKFEYYNDLGNEAKEQGNYGLAEKWYRRNDANIGSMSVDYQFSYHTNLCNLYAEAGKLDEALEQAMICKQVFQKGCDRVREDYYMPYLSIAQIYQRKGDSVRCFQCLDSLFVAWKKYDEVRKAHLYNVRAGCYSSFQNYGLALADYKKADSVMAARFREDDKQRIVLLPLIGGMEHHLGHYDESERLYKRYATGIRNLYGENHAKYIDALCYLANAEGFAGHIEEACRDYMAAVDLLKPQIQRRLPWLTNAEREGYWKSVSRLFQDMTPFALKAEACQTVFTKSCYDCLVLSKAFLLASERSALKLIKEQGTEEDLNDYGEIASMQTIVKKLERNGDLYRDSILKLVLKTEQLEARLAKRCRSFGDMTAFMHVDYSKIRENLHGDEVLIDFTDFVSESRGRIYAAYVVDGKQEFPVLKRLFAESRIDSMRVPYPHCFYESPYAEEMLRMLWTPLKDYVKEGGTVYYVPSQMLFQIALESLPLADGTLLGEHYHFVRLSSARELVHADARLHWDIASSNANVVLYGGLKYDLDTNVMKGEAGKYDISSMLAVRGGIRKGDSVFRELRGAKREIDSIEKIFTPHHLVVSSYTGERGTEESFLNMSGKAPQILHIATHGFFYTPDEAKEIDYLRGYQDAMSLSGLVMSGGNAAWRGHEPPQGVLGGILTASNIARLDLGNTQLAVLSACHSGKGKETPEGLYGLQRAFKKAGAGTMVMSLWEVNDFVGTEFIVLFYRYLADKENHWNKREAFEKAKAAIREKYPQPYYWAGFIMLD